MVSRVIHRRHALGFLGAAMAAPALWRASPAAAQQSPPPDAQVPGVYRTSVGRIGVTTLYDGELRREVTDGYVRNASLADLQDALTDALLPPTHFNNPYTFTAIETGGQRLLVDTGTGGSFVPTINDGPRAMAAAGIVPEEIDAVILTHFHPDHVGGLTDEHGQPRFPNAQILFPVDEFGLIQNDGFVANMPPMMRGFALAARERLTAYGDAVHLFNDGDVLAEGVRAFATPGHTQGHMAVIVDSDGETMIILGDAITYPALFVPNPGWHVVFDGDGPQAEATRIDLLRRASASGARLVGTHFPFPSIGRVARRDSGFQYVPERWSSL